MDSREGEGTFQVCKCRVLTVVVDEGSHVDCPGTNYQLCLYGGKKEACKHVVAIAARAANGCMSGLIS
jgi:hypothetical protein